MVHTVMVPKALPEYPAVIEKIKALLPLTFEQRVTLVTAFPTLIIVQPEFLQT
jgi:hypothetical protein